MLSAPVEIDELLAAAEPVISPLAVHGVAVSAAPVDVQAYVVLAPCTMVLAPTLTVTVGSGTPVMTVLAEPVPNALVQLIVKVLFAPVSVMFPEVEFPEADGPVTHVPLVPLAVQLVGEFVADHVMVVARPTDTELAAGVMVTTGLAAGPELPTLRLAVAVLLVPPAFEH